jgi:hypothetical protein
VSFSNSAENSLWLLIFNNTNMANVGDATGLRGSSTAGSLYVTLHSADPGEAGNQGTSEITAAQHGGYARQAVARSSAGWTVSGTAPTQVVNAADIVWPVGTAGSGTIAKFFSIGVSATLGDTGVIIVSGELLGPAVVVTVDTAADKLLATSHGFTNGQAVQVRVANGTLPSPLATATQYFVVGATTNDFQLSATQGGSAIDLTTVGSGTITVALDKSIPVGLNVTPKILASQLVATLD